MEGTSELSQITALKINMNICLFYFYFYTYFFVFIFFMKNFILFFISFLLYDNSKTICYT